MGAAELANYSTSLLVLLLNNFVVCSAVVLTSQELKRTPAPIRTSGLKSKK
jgi:hypothetical protein